MNAVTTSFYAACIFTIMFWPTQRMLYLKNNELKKIFEITRNLPGIFLRVRRWIPRIYLPSPKLDTRGVTSIRVWWGRGPRTIHHTRVRFFLCFFKHFHIFLCYTWKIQINNCINLSISTFVKWVITIFYQCKLSLNE